MASSLDVGIGLRLQTARLLCSGSSEAEGPGKTG
jgi:hypothetical protein